MLNEHWFPTVRGPHGEWFITDHHHLGQALTQEGVKDAWALPMADFSGMGIALFWRLMSFRHWAHPADEHGAVCEFSSIPKTLGELRDDPYRSLAGAVRRAGGYSKESEPYVEFLWADYFRSQFTIKQLQPTAAGTLSAKVLAKAVESAKSTSAQNLPGWSGAFTQTDFTKPTDATSGKKASAKKSRKD